MLHVRCANYYSIFVDTYIVFKMDRHTISLSPEWPLNFNCEIFIAPSIRAHISSTSAATWYNVRSFVHDQCRHCRCRAYSKRVQSLCISRVSVCLNLATLRIAHMNQSRIISRILYSDQSVVNAYAWTQFYLSISCATCIRAESLGVRRVCVIHPMSIAFSASLLTRIYAMTRSKHTLWKWWMCRDCRGSPPCAECMHSPRASTHSHFQWR